MRLNKKSLLLGMIVLLLSCIVGSSAKNSSFLENVQASMVQEKDSDQSQDQPEIGVSALGYCVMNADTGEIVLQKNADEKLHPASITKIMTLLVTVEQCKNLDSVTTVSENALNQIAPLSSTLHPMPKPGEQFTIRDLLYGLTMCSGNECANILAEAVCGDIDSFVELMNERAKEAGAKNTHFSNPHGLDADDHLTTAYDMALIMKAALKNPAAKEILSAKTYTIPETAYTSERNMTSGHKMVSGEFECEGVYAGKPGYTRLAQSTLVTAAKRDDVNLIAVVMKSDSGISYEDTSLLLDNAYAKINDWGVTGGFNVYHPRVTQIDDAGFTVTWDVGLDAVRAEFPVWIEYDSTDVLTKGSLEVTSDTISYHVSLSDHAGKNGVYTVQAYVYNASGESKVCSIKVLAGVGEQKGFVNWNGSTYYVHENGALGLQWQELEEGCYYFDYTTAQMVTGWVGSDTKFYLDPDGKLHTGWLELDGKQYYFYQAGDMATGKMTIGNGEYYFDENGVMLTGWQCVKEKAEPGDGTGISRFVYLGGKEKGMLKGQWFETTEKPWDTKAWSTALNTQAVRKNNTDETALMKKDGSRWFYLENDGTPLFLSADATGLKDGAVKLDGRYYFFDSYGVCQSGMIKFTSGGKTETAYFDPEAGGALSIGRNTNVVDKRDKVYTFCSGTSGSEKGCGINGVKDGFLYYNGLLVSAKEGSSYEPFKVSGQVYLVNEAGKVQTEEKKYSSDGNAAYTIENGKVFTLDENGEKKSAATGLSLPYASWKIQYQR